MQRPQAPYQPLKPTKPEKYISGSSNYVSFDRDTSIGEIIDKFKKMFPDITEEEIRDITIDIDYGPYDYTDDKIETYFYKESQILNPSYEEEMKAYDKLYEQYEKNWKEYKEKLNEYEQWENRRLLIEKKERLVSLKKEIEELENEQV